MSAAAIIEKGTDKDLFVALDWQERDAILSVLENPPPGLEDLRRALGRE